MSNNSLDITHQFKCSDNILYLHITSKTFNIYYTIEINNNNEFILNGSIDANFYNSIAITTLIVYYLIANDIAIIINNYYSNNIVKYIMKLTNSVKLSLL